MVVYHYTTYESYQSITITGQIVKSNPWTTMDAAYGTGWYFTDMTPDGCDYTIMQVCWWNTTAKDRIAYYLKFDIPTWLLKKCRDSVYMVSQWDSQIRYLGGGAKTTCSLKPCTACNIYQQYYSGK